MKAILSMAGLILLAAATLRADGLVNLSARSVTSASGEVLTAGFVISGSGMKRVLVRGAGPALTQLGVGGALAQVRLQLYRGAELLAVNSGWDAGGAGAAVAAAAQAVSAFAYQPGSGDAAVLLTLAPGNYTAQVLPGGPAVSGVALVEVYDLEPESTARLINLSARARAGGGTETFIAGFAVGGAMRNRILVRGIGPALAGFGVQGVLADPRLEIFQGSNGIAYNEDWAANSHGAQLEIAARAAGAFALASTARDAALLLPGASGSYTAHVTGASGQGGVALIEVYDTAGQASLPPARAFDLIGFGRVPGHGLAALTGGGLPTTPYDPATGAGNFWRIDEATVAAAGAAFGPQLQAALATDRPLVIELNTMLDLARVGRPNNGATAIAHPELFAPGRTNGTVGMLLLGANKTIYSAFGNGGFRRGTIAIGGRSNLILRNLAFRELWEWDDATLGDYDRNGWDYLSVTSATNGPLVTERAHHVWIDHCDFEKSYDGSFDFVRGADLITVSWTRIGGVVSGDTARWVQRQFEHLEANRAQFPYYNFLRGFRSVADIYRREVFQLKGNLVGNGTDANTAAQDTGHLNVTFHHNAYVAVDQRMPRMRFGNAHVFNLLADSSAGRGVSDLSQAGVAATSGAAVRLDRSRFVDARTAVTNQVGLEPLGRIAVVGSVNFDPITGTDKGFDPGRIVPVSQFRWNVPAAATGLAGWPVSDSAVMPAGYVPAGRILADYIDAADFMTANPAAVGVILPADANEAERLRRWLQGTTTDQ